MRQSHETRSTAITLPWDGVTRYVAHGRRVIAIAEEYGWKPGARYTNLRDIRATAFEGVGFLDIHWKKYDFSTHVAAAEESKPLVTVARDIEDIRELDLTLREAESLNRFSKHVIVVPKDPKLAGRLDELIPPRYLLGYSVPTKYGGTKIPPSCFKRPVHLLGGRPDVQRRVAQQMPVVSFDCNRFTLDAAFGDYFDGVRFRPHPTGGYETCIRASLQNIEALWRDYDPHAKQKAA